MTNMTCILVIIKKDKGWTKAQNLGSQINSEFSEACPYISPDGQYLFFLRLSQGGSEIYWIHTKHIETLAIE